MSICDIVAFDLDGTLIDTLALHIAATRAAVKAVFNANISDSEIKHSLGQPLPAAIAMVSNGRGQELALRMEYLQYYAEHQSDGAVTFPEVPDILSTLQNNGVHLALLSNKLRRWGNEEIDRLNLRRFFEVVVFAEDMPSPKPSGLALQPIVRKTGVAPHRILVVGDSEGDLICAKSAGAMSGAALWGTYQPEILHALSPNYLFQTLSDVIATVLPP